MGHFSVNFRGFMLYHFGVRLLTPRSEIHPSQTISKPRTSFNGVCQVPGRLFPIQMYKDMNSIIQGKRRIKDTVGLYNNTYSPFKYLVRSLVSHEKLVLSLHYRSEITTKVLRI